MSFTLTPRAQRFMRTMIFADGGPGAGFRLAVSPGGCAGLSADISVRSTPLEGDATIERDGVKLFLAPGSRMWLEGVTIDFADSAAHTGLVFRDPKQVACGHGSK